ncbi:hypothetical protein EDD11_006984 [Mortierella claussenii]|nr:hypothetical protein EDD11_006984 [Mortierella claussenii]
MRPPPMMQQQPRPRPQAASHGQGLPQQANSHQTVQPDMPLVDSRTNGEADPPGARQFSQQQLSQQSSQRPPGARPILDQLRQHNQQAQVSGQVAHGQAPHNMNPTQRQPQRPPAPLQGQLPRPQQPSNSSQHHAREAALAKDHSPSPPGRNVDVRTSNGDHGRPERQSPQQQPTFLPNQRPANPQQLSGPALGQHQQHSSPVGQTSPSRPYVVPGSPRQRPLEGAEIKAPGQITGTPSHQPPQAQQPPQKTQQHASQLPQQHASQLPQQHASQPEASTQLAELDAPLSDVEGDAFDEDDIKGGSVGAPKPHPAEFAVDGHAPQPTAAAGGPSAGPPPTGPPTGPPRGPPKNITVGRPGPARVISPLNNPSSPPESAFPQPRSRIRPPPNKEFTPYRPPERPSQAPIMYSQSGQPTFSQPFPQQDEKLSAGLVADKSSGPATTSTVPQGADATSSSIRPREGGLQKRVFASDNKTTKPEAVPGANLISPPSPKLHGRKGPAILNVSGQRSSFSSSSAVKMLKTWAIRGGLTYLGYTAIFNCPSDSTGVKGLYCKATNGVGGLAKPYVAPHYNAYVGPHVDRFVKPVARGGHHIYLKVANPVVQGALSAAGSVYRITAKKHVDSAKDQVISILPYPFKKPGMTGAASDKDSDKIPDEKQQQKDTHDKEQPAEKMQHIVESIENTVEAVKESVAEKLEEMVNSVQEEIAEVKNTVREQAAPIKEVVQQKEQEVENKVEEAVRQVEEQMKEQEQLAQEQEQEQEHEKEENEDEQKPHANGHRPSSDDENKVVESNGHEEGHGQLEKKSENSDDSDEHQHEDEKKVLDSSFMDKTAASKDSLKNVQDDGEQNGTGNYDQEQHGVSEEHKETVPTEDEQERQPSPEPAAAVEPNPTPEPTVINEEQQADAVAQEPPMTTPVEDAVESSADVPETETAEARPGFEDPETALFDGAEAAPDVTETSPKGFDEHKKPAEVEASAPVEEKDQNQLPVETEIQDHTEQIKEEPMREHQHEGEVDAEQGQQAALASLDATHDDNATKAHDEL